MAPETIATINKEHFTMGDRMRLARIGSGLTVPQVSELMGLKPASLYGRENGNDVLTPRFIGRFEDALGIVKGTVLKDECALNPLPEPEEKKPYVKRVRKNPAQGTIEITRILRQRIADGTYQGKLPTGREIRDEFGHSRNTVDSALRNLRNEGLIKGNKHGGTHILKDE